MPADLPEALAQRLKIRQERIPLACELLDAGLSPAFIAHYRKAETGGMDETTLRRLADARRELATLEDLRRRAKAVAEQAAALTPDLARRLDEATDPDTIEDLVQPVRPKRRTAATVAAERGLAPLADYALAGPADGPDLLVKAAEFVNPEKEVRSPQDALAGAGHVLAERFANDPRVRRAARRVVWENGLLKSVQAKARAKQAGEFHGYFDFSEALSHVPPHRVMAINRGERIKVLKVTIAVPPEALREHVLPLVVPKEHRFAAFLETILADALQRLVLPTAERRARRLLTERAELHAIEVFSSNLRSLLMARPVPGQRVLAIQPGYRTGCKTAALDAAGVLLGETIVYPLEPQKRWDEAKTALLIEIRRHGITCIAIGNGTGCREVEQLVSEVIEGSALGIEYTIVSEAGAAAYADSDLAKRNFGHLEAAIRATISIGRRLQDPLAELVKIDPRAIGVGLYQHDVNQDRLRRALDETMESCTAAVGADANTASPPMLRRIPTLGDAQVLALATQRVKAPLAGREELRSLPGWDEKTFLQAAGFLRVRGANPLDATRIHPESYPDAERLLAHLGLSLDDLRLPDKTEALRQRLSGLLLEPLVDELKIPLLKLMDLVGALQNPQYDPRSENHGPVFRRKMRELADLKPGMWIKGTVRNVVDFGAFVDVGLKEEGLIHISQFSRRYVRNPLKFLHVGDMVDVRIVAIEADKHRISLTLIPEKPDRHRTPPAGRKPSEGAAARAARPAGRTPAAGTARAAPRPGDGQAPAPPRSADRRAPAGAGRGDHSAGRSDRSRDARSDRPPRGRSERRPRTGPPRIIVSKAKTDAVDRPPDDMGRPRLRWAYYESDPQEDLYGNTDLEQEPPAAESPETPAPEDEAPQPEAPVAADEAPQPETPAPQDETPQPEAPQAPEGEPPAAQASAAPTPETQGPPDQPQ
jgi:uncharacterized protein